MKVSDFLNKKVATKGLSFEVLPPLKGNGTAQLFRTIDKLREFNPNYINITTHNSEFVYRELENGQYERDRIRRRPGTIAIAAAIQRDIPIHEYAPLKIKMAITGQGQASKEQVAGMLKRMLKLSDEDMPKFMDATDALGAAYCHFLQMGRPETDTKYKGWKDFVSRNQNRVAGK